MGNTLQSLTDLTKSRWIITERRLLLIRTKQKVEPRKRRTATTPEARENQLIAMAVDLAERQLIEGTASSQVITHFLKLASSRERLEYEIKEKQKELIEAKTESIQSAQRVEELYKNALNAMRNYSGQTGVEDDEL